jgi:hypothetical protein
MQLVSAPFKMHYPYLHNGQTASVIRRNFLTLWSSFKLHSKYAVRTAKKTPHFTIAEISWLTLFKEKSPVYTDSRAKPMNTKCRGIYIDVNVAAAWLQLGFKGFVPYEICNCLFKWTSVTGVGRWVVETKKRLIWISALLSILTVAILDVVCPRFFRRRMENVWWQSTGHVSYRKCAFAQN